MNGIGWGGEAVEANGVAVLDRGKPRLITVAGDELHCMSAGSRSLGMAC